MNVPSEHNEPALPKPLCRNGCAERLTLLAMVLVDGVTHDDPQHYRLYSVVCVLSCETCGAGLYWHFEHDCTGYPTSNLVPPEGHWMLPIAPDDIERLRDGLRDCPDLKSGSCQCSAHHALVSSMDSLRHLYGEPPATAATVVLDDSLPRLAPLHGDPAA